MSTEKARLRSLEKHLTNAFNLSTFQIYQKYHWFDPVGFFKAQQSFLDSMLAGKTLSALEALREREPSVARALLFIYILCERVRFELDQESAGPDALLIGLQLLQNERQRLQDALNFDPSDPGRYPQSWNLKALATSSLPDDQAKLAMITSEMLREVMDNWTARIVQRAHRESDIDLTARESERQRIHLTTAQQNPEFTTTRQVLALSYMLKALGRRTNKRTNNKSEEARFIEFLTGKNQKEVYKRLGDPTAFYSSGGADAQYAIDRFRKLGLNEVAEMVEKDDSNERTDRKA